jgi:hypothetical protein
VRGVIGLACAIFLATTYLTHQQNCSIVLLGSCPDIETAVVCRIMGEPGCA